MESEGAKTTVRSASTRSIVQSAIHVLPLPGGATRTGLISLFDADFTFLLSIRELLHRALKSFLLVACCPFKLGPLWRDSAFYG